MFALRELPGAFKEFTGFEPDIRPGGVAVQKTFKSPPVEGANNIGTQGLPIDDPCFVCEGGPVSTTANKIPGVNAIAAVHDIFQVSLGDGLARNLLNVPGMVPATAFALAALAGKPLTYLNSQQLLQLSISFGLNEENIKRRQALVAAEARRKIRISR